jgi:hypothetical protein
MDSARKTFKEIIMDKLTRLGHPIEIVHVTQSESGDSESGFTFAMTIFYREI